MRTVLGYFNGKTVVQVPRDGYTEPVSIPKVGMEVVNKAISAAVEAGALWLTNGPASVLAEPIPMGVLTLKAILREPPAMIAAAEILPENLPDAWSEGQATALSIATALSQRFGHTMPWKTVKDVITASINARFTELDGTSGEWPCDYPAAQAVKLKVSSAPAGRPGISGIGPATPAKCLVALAELEPSEIQDLAVSDDAKTAKKNFPDLGTLLFVTSAKVSNANQKRWEEAIWKDHGVELHIIEREDIIAEMRKPENTSLCVNFLHLDIVSEPQITDLISRTRRAADAVTGGWARKTKGHPLIELTAVRLDPDGAESAEVLSLEQIDRALSQSRRIVLEGPAGRGKTTTLIQLAQRVRAAGIPFIVELPAWTSSGRGILEYIAGMPTFQAEGLTSADLARVQQTEPFLLLLNGWNEIAESNSAQANDALRELERDFPSVGIIVATRMHHLTPPLPGALRLRLLRLRRVQRAAYLAARLGARVTELRTRIDADPLLDELTRTPFILSEVVSLFEAGAEKQRTRFAVASNAEIKRLREQNQDGKPAAGLNELAKALAAIDGRGSTSAVLDVIAMPGQWDQYTCLDAAERLLMAGVVLPATTAFALVDSIVERTGKWMQDSDRYLLCHILALCPFVDEPAAGIAKMREVLGKRRFWAYELRELVSALGESRSDTAVDLLYQLASDAPTFKECEGNFIKALAALDTPRARELLLGFVDPDIHGIALTRRLQNEDVLVARLTELAHRRPEVAARLLELCERDLPELNRHVLSKVMNWLGTPEAVAANLNLIDDAKPLPVPQGIWDQLETAFVERRPYGQSPNVFTQHARASNELRVRLFRMAIGDEKRRKSAFMLLGQIEEWRLERGRPTDEPRHPDLASGQPWPLQRASGA